MPTFDYTCQDCAHIFEFNKPFGSKTIPACPMCNCTDTKKSIHIPGIAFKGTGFYVNDSQAKKTEVQSEVKRPDVTDVATKASEVKPELAVPTVKIDSKTA